MTARPRLPSLYGVLKSVTIRTADYCYPRLHLPAVIGSRYCKSLGAEHVRTAEAYHQSPGRPRGRP